MATQAQIDALTATAQGIKTKIDALATSSNAPGGQSPADPLQAQLMQQLTQQSGIISSSEKDVNDLLVGAQNNLKQGAASNAQAVTTQYDRLEGYQRDANQQTLTSTLESQRGFATNTALLTQINEQGQKSLNDLEQRKQELILSGNADASSKISALQVQQAQFMLQNRQQVFTNLISLAGVNQGQQSLGLQRAQLAQSAAQFDKTMTQKLGDTALRYGIQMQAGDTVESVINRAYPNASAEEKFNLDDMRAGLALKNAQIALARAQAADIGNKNAPMSETDFANLMDGISTYGGPESSFAKNVFSSLAQSGKLADLQKAVTAANKPRNYTDSQLNQKAIMMFNSALDIDSAIGKIENDPSITNKQRAKDITRLYYNKPIVESASAIMAKDWTSNNRSPGSQFPSPFGR